MHCNSHIDYVNGNATKIQNIYHWMRKILDQLFPLLVSRNSILETKSITLTLLYFLPLYFVIFLYFYFHQKINQKNEPLKIKKSFWLCELKCDNHTIYIPLDAQNSGSMVCVVGESKLHFGNKITLLYFLPLYFVTFLYFYFHQKLNQKNEPLKIKKSFWLYELKCDNNTKYILLDAQNSESMVCVVG